jgi:hypothetical protein
VSDEIGYLLPRWWVTVTCTDRGQHRPNDLGEVSVVDRPGHGLGVVRVAEGRRPAGRHRSVWVDTGGRLNLRCARCGRHIEWRGDRAAEQVTRLHAAGLDHVDVSHLP